MILAHCLRENDYDFQQPVHGRGTYQHSFEQQPSQTHAKTRNRAQIFRKKNTETMDNLTKELESKLLLPNGLEYLNELKQAPTHRTVTTQEIGLLLPILTQWFQNNLGPLNIHRFNVFSFYRVLMAKLQCKVALISQKGLSTTYSLEIPEPIGYEMFHKLQAYEKLIDDSRFPLDANGCNGRCHTSQQRLAID